MVNKNSVENQKSAFNIPFYFIAEKFEENGFKHLTDYKWALNRKSVPIRNSPTNEAGKH